MDDEIAPEGSEGPSLYRVGGLLISVAGPEDPLFERVPSGAPDIVIGSISSEVAHAAWQGAGDAVRHGDVVVASDRDGGYVLRFPGWFEAVVGADGRDIGVFELERWTGLSRTLFGTVVPLALAARGCVALHASAVDVEGTALLLMGERGAGKSTLATALCLEGARLLADDITYLRLDSDGTAMVEPSGGATRLFPAVAARMGPAVADPLAHKQLLGRPLVGSADASSRLRAVRVLESGGARGESATRPVLGADTVVVMLHHMLAAVGGSRRGHGSQHQVAFAVAEQAEIRRMTWLPDVSVARAVAKVLIEELGQWKA
ncbi:MAG TPA: hypothetical protein VM388_00260 [Acidimicrobiales bacterium]|nr:hypothetical protein [Acidimicrobiales bacterium]